MQSSGRAFDRLAAYEDVNNTEPQRHDPAMRWIVEQRAIAGLFVPDIRRQRGASAACCARLPLPRPEGVADQDRRQRHHSWL